MNWIDYDCKTQTFNEDCEPSLGEKETWFRKNVKIEHISNNNEEEDN